MYDISELNAKKVDELKAIAKDLSVTNINKFKKDDLVYKILDAQAEQPQPDAPKVQPKPKPIKPKVSKPKPVKKAPEAKAQPKKEKPAAKKVDPTPKP